MKEQLTLQPECLVPDIQKNVANYLTAFNFTTQLAGTISVFVFSRASDKFGAKAVLGLCLFMDCVGYFFFYMVSISRFPVLATVVVHSVINLIAGGMTFRAVANAIIARSFDKSELGKWFGYLSGLASFVMVIGPIVGSGFTKVFVLFYIDTK